MPGVVHGGHTLRVHGAKASGHSFAVHRSRQFLVLGFELGERLFVAADRFLPNLFKLGEPSSTAIPSPRMTGASQTRQSSSTNRLVANSGTASVTHNAAAANRMAKATVPGSFRPATGRRFSRAASRIAATNSKVGIRAFRGSMNGLCRVYPPAVTRRAGQPADPNEVAKARAGGHRELPVDDR